MNKNIYISAKVHIQVTVNDEEDISKYDGLYDFGCRIIDGLNIKVEETTGKATLKTVLINNFESEVFEGELEEDEIEKIGNPKTFEIIDGYGYSGSTE
jgi:hypothetical protein